MDGEGRQLRLFDDDAPASPRPGVGGEGGTGPAGHEESQAPAASGPARALTERLMEEVRRRENLNRARMAATPAAHEAMPPAWFRAQGLMCLADRHAALQH